MKEPAPATQQEMMDNLVPLHVRDNCANILIPLNKLAIIIFIYFIKIILYYVDRCRRANYYLPWKCEHERHSYEICMYKEYEKRREFKKNNS